MNKNQSKFLLLNNAILHNKDLTASEALVIGKIDSFQGNCFASNEYLACIARVTPASLANMLTSLRKRGFLETRTNGHGQRVLSATNKAKEHSYTDEYNSCTDEHDTKQKSYTHESDSRTDESHSCTNEPPSCTDDVQLHVQMNIDNSIDNNIDNNIDNSIRVHDEKNKNQKKQVQKKIAFLETPFASQDNETAQAAFADALGTEPRFANCDWDYYRKVMADYAANKPTWKNIDWNAAVRGWIMRDQKMRTIGQTNETKQYVNFREREQQKRDEELKQRYYELVINPQPNDPNALPF